MERDTDVIALVGAGENGTALLQALLGVPGVEVRCVFDADPDAPGIALAREHGIHTGTDGRFDELAADSAVGLVLVTSGDPEVPAAVRASAHPDTCVLSGAGLRLVERLSEERRRTAALLADANLEKARYLRQASHQIKSPLSSVQSYVNVILGGYTGEIPERTREIVEKIHARIEAALAALAKRRMLADLRCVERDDLELDTVGLADLVGRAVAAETDLAARRGVEVRVLPGAAPGLVRCDPQKTVALLTELVENAVVYSREQGVVEVAVTAGDDGSLAVAVRDHGIGVPERCLPRIFDEDYRADIAAQYNPEGAGLGLTIAREIAGLHGFALAAESEEGQGSVFTLTVPPRATA